MHSWFCRMFMYETTFKLSLTFSSSWIAPSHIRILICHHSSSLKVQRAPWNVKHSSYWWSSLRFLSGLWHNWTSLGYLRTSRIHRYLKLFHGKKPPWQNKYKQTCQLFCNQKEFIVCLQVAYLSPEKVRSDWFWTKERFWFLLRFVF